MIRSLLLPVLYQRTFVRPVRGLNKLLLLF